jgi:hypothetical protein
MGKVKAWLMEIEEHAFNCIEEAALNHQSVDIARIKFLEKYPNQKSVFEHVVEEYQEHIGEMAQLSDPELIKKSVP